MSNDLCDSWDRHGNHRVDSQERHVVEVAPQNLNYQGYYEIDERVAREMESAILQS